MISGELKAFLSGQMQLWREGLRSLPQMYVDVHAQAAKEDLPRICTKLGLVLEESRMVPDG